MGRVVGEAFFMSSVKMIFAGDEDKRKLQRLRELSSADWHDLSSDDKDELNKMARDFLFVFFVWEKYWEGEDGKQSIS